MEKRQSIRLPAKLASLLAVLCVALVPLSSTAQTADFVQVSSPAGILSQSNSVAIPATVTTQTAPLESGSLRFTHWEKEGERPPDGALGRAANPVTFMMTQAVTLTAFYLPVTRDSNGDGLPDWYAEWMTADTNTPASQNIDADALSLVSEYHRDTHDRVADDFFDGGVSWADEAMVVLTDPAFARYVERTSPAGFHEEERIVAVGSTQFVPDVTGAHPEFVFAQWSAKGIRLEDDRGRSRGGLGVLVTNDTVAEALFVPALADTNTNSIPDWFEWNYMGAPTSAPPSDSDMDGLSLADEYRRDTHPAQADSFSPGGVSWRDDALALNFAGIVRYAFVSDPAGWVDQSGQAATGTVAVSPFLYGEDQGYTFAQWSIDGVRQTDGYGVALNQLEITLVSNVTAVATYRPTTQDTNGDGVPDWAELKTFGVVTNAADTDADGDGLTFLAEFQRQTNPHLNDTIERGGVSWRGDSAAVNLRLLGPDTDGDDMPDWWEQQHFQTLARTGTNNFDGDGLTDLEEWIALSNPTNAADTFAVAIIGGGVLEWPAASGRLYFLDSCTNLLSPDWEALPAIPGDGDLHSVTNPYPDPKRYFRLRVTLP